MLKIVQIIELIKNSTSKLLKAECSDGLVWIVRLKRSGNNSQWFTSSKRLFSSYLASLLANELGVNTPAAFLAQVKFDCKFYELLKVNEELFDEKCNIGVAQEYIQLTDQSKLYDNYPEFLSLLRNSDENSEQICGMKFLLHWIYLDDYGKNENLQFDPHGKLYFLDFDMAFTNSGDSNIWSRLREYDWTRIQTDPANFFSGFTEDVTPYEIWFERLLKLDFTKIHSNLEKIPDCWGVSPDYLNNTLAFLFSNREKYIAEFKDTFQRKIKWKQMKNKLY